MAEKNITKMWPLPPEYYNRAIKRINYISEILQGEMPTDDSIVITTENDAPGFKEIPEKGERKRVIPAPKA
ncbi:MAG: hypothetical protein ACLUOI_19690 [Eisenbergiella sp.]